MPMDPYPGCFSCKITGRVTDNSNNPLGGIDIEWDPVGIGYFMKVAETDKGGGFATYLAPIPKGYSRQIIKANDKSRKLEQVWYQRVSPNVTSEINFTLK